MKVYNYNEKKIPNSLIIVYFKNLLIFAEELFFINLKNDTYIKIVVKIGNK